MPSYEPTTRTQRRGRTLEQLAADRVEDEVDRGEGLLEPAAPTVEHLVRAVGARGLHSVRGRGADDVGAAPPCQLRREVSDTARSAVDQDALPLLEPSMVEEPLPGAERSKWNRCARNVIERGRLGC